MKNDTSHTGRQIKNHTKNNINSYTKNNIIKRNRSSIERIIYIHNRAKHGDCPKIKDIAEKFEVSPRTIDRDIEFMRDRLSAPLEYDRNNNCYKYAHSFELPLFSFTEGEVIAFYLGEKLLLQCLGTPYEPFIRTAMEKMRIMLPGSVELDSNSLEELVSFSMPSLRGDDKVVAHNYALIFQAIKNSKVINISYYAPSTDEVTQRDVEPYHLVVKDGACYLIGFCRFRDEFRMFSIDRIQTIKELNDEYKRDPSFSLEDYLHSAWGLEKGELYEVKLKFDAYQARWIRERTWHKSQVVTDLPDGGCILTLIVEGIGEIKRWVMQFGSHVEVLSPDELRDEIVMEIKEMERIYCKEDA